MLGSLIALLVLAPFTAAILKLQRSGVRQKDPTADEINAYGREGSRCIHRFLAAAPTCSSKPGVTKKTSFHRVAAAYASITKCFEVNVTTPVQQCSNGLR